MYTPNNTVIKPKSRDVILGGGSGGSGSYVPCSGAAYWCAHTCTVCWSSTAPYPVLSNCTNTQSALTADCPTPPPGPARTPDYCYSIGCVGLPPPYIEPAKVEASAIIDTSLQAYPNPASGQLILTSTNAGAHFLILDVLGREVLNGLIPLNGSLTLDVSSLPSGTYYVSEGHSEVKFVKN